jgi:hypothetical protein
MFHVRTIRPDSGKVEVSAFDLEPALQQGILVCNLFAEFLADRPGEFRERLPFLTKHDIELQWAAASGGAAFAGFFYEGRTLGMAVLLSGANAEEDQRMIEALQVSILGPMLGEAASGLTEAPERPVMLVVEAGDAPEMLPTLHLLATALASVYFRAIRRLAQ